MIHDTQSAQISRKQDERNIYAIMKTVCLPGYHHNGFVATHALGHMMYGYTLLVPMKECSTSKEHNMLILLFLYIYIYVYIFMYISEHKQNAHNDGNKAQPLNSF